jgi:CheY-like chemotaxis protein
MEPPTSFHKRSRSSRSAPEELPRRPWTVIFKTHRDRYGAASDGLRANSFVTACVRLTSSRCRTSSGGKRGWPRSELSLARLLRARTAMDNALSNTVLVVDDDVVVRRILAELVASRGHEVLEATDGDDAWTQLKRTRFDVVISDLQMPRCDGHELCRRIRAEPALRHVRVVIVTGCQEVPDRQHLNCDAILHKPIAVDALLNEIAPRRRIGALFLGTV